MRHESLMLEQGEPAPAFHLPDSTGKLYSLDDFSDSPVLVVAFICNHCPFVLHLVDAFVEFAREYKAKGVATVAISSNDIVAFPEDGPELMGPFAEKYGFTFPYLYDEDQSVARAYLAACTPDFSVYDKDRRLAYRGRFDKSRPTTEHVQGNTLKPDGADLRAAVDAVLAGTPVATDQFPSMGCSMKWKAGNEPVWEAIA